MLDTPCILTTYALEGGYGRLKFNGKNELHHRVVYCQHNKVELATIKDVVIRHRCDNRACVNPTHLLPGTKKDNTKDRMDRHGPPNHGLAYAAKLTEEQVAEILARNRDQQAQLAIEFNVSKSAIQAIQAGKNMKRLLQSQKDKL